MATDPLLACIPEEIRAMNDGRGPSCTTYTGRHFYILDPRDEDLTIIDAIQNASRQCRFGGLLEHHYCVTPEMRVLTSDLRWIPAGELKAGDMLLAFDEHPPEGARTRRRLRPAQVVSCPRIYRPVYRLRLSDGTNLRSSAEHPWLVCHKASGNQKWSTTERVARSLSEGGRRFINRFLHPWESLQTYEAGYLAGVLDGEGWVHRGSYSRHGQDRPSGFGVGFAQRNNVVLERARAVLDALGIAYHIAEQRKDTGVMVLKLNGQWSDRLRALGLIRPGRLIGSVERKLLSGELGIEFNAKERLRIEEVVFQGQQEVVALETTTKTFFCEGFAAHNSPAQHMTLCSWVARDVYGYDETVQYECHMHDIQEGFLIDMPRPIKLVLRGEFQFDATEQLRAYIRRHGWPEAMLAPALSTEPLLIDVKGLGYNELEDRIARAYARKYGFTYPMSQECREIDDRMLETERRDFHLKFNERQKWGGETKGRFDLRVIPTTAEYARDLWIRRFCDLSGYDHADVLAGRV